MKGKETTSLWLIVPCVTGTGPGLISAAAGTHEGLFLRAGFRHGDKQVPSATFHPSCATADWPYSSLESLCYRLHPISSDTLFPLGSLLPFPIAAEPAL